MPATTRSSALRRSPRRTRSPQGKAPAQIKSKKKTSKKKNPEQAGNQEQRVSPRGQKRHGRQQKQNSNSNKRSSPRSRTRSTTDRVKTLDFQHTDSKSSEDDSGATKDTPTWTKKRQLGSHGKDGVVYEVQGNDGVLYAMKEFKPKKAYSKFAQEVVMHKKAQEIGVAPKVMQVISRPPFRLVMEKLHETLVQVADIQGGVLTNEQQKCILALFNSLDRAGVYHNDANPLNIMRLKSTRKRDAENWFVIDYGFSKPIKVKANGYHPNVRAIHMLLFSPLQGLVTRGQLKKPGPALLVAASKAARDAGKTDNIFEHIDGMLANA